MQAIIVLNGTAEEIAALALAVQERQGGEGFFSFFGKIFQGGKKRVGKNPARD